MKFSSITFKSSAYFASFKSHLSGITMCLVVTSLVMVGCSQSEDTTVVQPSSDESSVEVASATTTKTTIAPTDPNNKTIVAENTPVNYDVKSWEEEASKDSTANAKAIAELGKINVKTLNKKDIEALQKVFGEVVTSDENSLDYASNSAIKYRFMKSDEPYLDIIDSQNYLEFGWYYANPQDSESEKKTSIANAKKVYTVARGLMGEDGGSLVAKILSGQIVKNAQIGGLQVSLAKCEFYSCMLIIKKENR